MESFKISRAEMQAAPSIETTANYEGNTTELLIERITDPHIKQQIINLLFESAADTVRDNKKNLVSYGKPEEELVRDPDGNVLPSKYFNFEEPSIEKIGEEFDKRIREVSEYTPISFSPTEISSPEAISINWAFPGQGKNDREAIEYR